MIIFRSLKIGVTYEIINVHIMKSMAPLEKIYFTNENNQDISAIYYDKIGNSFKRRFLLVNFPINVKLNFINKKKMKKNSSYQINILQNDTIIQEIKETSIKTKKILNDFTKMKIIVKEIDEFIKIDNKEINFDKMKEIIAKLSPYDDYFNQNLMNKEDNDWNYEELIFYYYYFKFKLFLNYKTDEDSKKINYYKCAIEIFENIYKELEKISNVTFYHKICAITSLYLRLKSDCEHKENKSHLIGQYKLLNINDNRIKCYNLVYKFVNNIIDNLKENSLIYLAILQVNSGFNKDINSDDEKEIFGLSMLNVDMIKRHLKLLMPKLIFLIRHPTIHSKRGSFCKATGSLFIYETSIFNNKIGKDIDNIINNQPEDAAIMISFVIFHEIFIHKKIRANTDFEKGKETPAKFIGPKYEIKNFYYSCNKKNLDPLSIYNKDKENDNKISKEGECGRMLEYFFENKNFEIINYLKKYIGFGDLLEKIDLIVEKILINYTPMLLIKLRKKKPNLY